MDTIFKESENGKIMKKEIGLKPIYIISPDTKDANVIAYGNLLHWSEAFADHMEYTEMLLPESMEKLAVYRASVIKHKKIFQSINEQAMQMEIDSEKVRDMLEELATHAEMITSETLDLREKQMAGQVHTFAWPLLMDHMAREGQYFLELKNSLRDGLVEIDTEKEMDFWGEIMREHGLFTAHLLDPTEDELITDGYDASDTFEEMVANPPTMQEALGDLNDMIEFKTTLLEGIEDGSINSMIMPELADHMLKEAYYFKGLLETASTD